MAVKLVFAPEVELDIEDAYQWYEDRRIGLGEEFLGCVEAGINFICRLPELHAKGNGKLPKAAAQAIPLRDILRIRK